MDLDDDELKATRKMLGLDKCIYNSNDGSIEIIVDPRVLKSMEIAKDLTIFELKDTYVPEDLIVRTYKRILNKLLEGE